MLYLHYWFANYAEKNNVSLNSNDLYSNFNAAIASTQYLGSNGKLMKEFKQRKAKMVIGSPLSEYEELLDFVSDPNTELAKMRYDTYQQNVVQSWKPVSELKTIALGEDIAQDVSNFMQQLKAKIDEMSKKLNLNLDDFKSAVINEYAQTKHLKVGSKKFSQSIIKDFITHDGIKKLNLKSTPGTESATLNSCIRSIMLLAEALPDYGSNGRMTLSSMRYSTSTKSNLVSGSGSATLGIIAGKLSGLWNNVVGKGGEIAWSQAELQGEEEISKKIDQINKSINKQIAGKDMGFSVSVTGEKTVADNKTNTKKISKPDVVVNIGKNNVTIEYGVSVKQYSFNTKTNSGTVSIVSQTSFLEAVRKYSDIGKDYGYLINLAGGHPGKGTSNQSAKEYTTAALNNAWQNLVSSVVIRNFLDFVAGVAATSPSVLYIVSNGNIVPIEDLLTNLDSSKIIPRVYEKTQRKNGYGSRSLTRASLMKMNQWIWANKGQNKTRVTDKDAQLGQERSSQFAQQIYNRLAQQKLDVSLNMLLT